MHKIELGFKLIRYSNIAVGIPYLLNRVRSKGSLTRTEGGLLCDNSVGTRFVRLGFSLVFFLF